MLALLTALLLTGICAAPALAARGHEFGGAFGWGVLNGASELQRCTTSCQTGLAGNGPGQFDQPAGIAVNESTGEVYVVDKGNDRVEVFNASGTKLEGEFNGSGLLANEEGKAAGGGGGSEEVPTGQFDEPEGIAVDNDSSSPSFGDVYVVDTNGHKIGTFEEERMVIDKFSPSGKYIGQITRNPDGEPFSEHGFRGLFGVAVDPGGVVWVEGENLGISPAGAANYTNAVANAWIGFRSTEESLRSSVPAPGFAVDSEDNLYVHNTFGSGDRLAKFTKEGKLITPEVDEEAPTGVAVELTSNDVYIAHATNVHRVDPEGLSLESLKAPGAGGGSGVAINSTTLTLYLADPAANRVDVFSPEAPGHPSIQAGSEAVSDVSATSASFSAEVNPRSEENEAPTSYRFEYGPCETIAACPSAPYTESIPAPEGSLPANYEPDLVGAHPQDLLASTVYHMRVVAHNSHPGSAESKEVRFTTQGPGSATLPDARQWELVSPADKHGALLLPIEGSGLIQAATSGDAFSYLANAPTESAPAGFSQTVQVLSRRGAHSWESKDIATSHEATVGISTGAGQGEYRFFADDLSSAVAQPFGSFTQATSPQASEQTAYLRSDFPAGDPAHPCSSSCYRPLVSGCPGGGEPCPGPVQEVANVPEGTRFGEDKAATCTGTCGPYFLGASPDASHIVLSAKAALIEGAPEDSLYEWAGGKLTLVSVLPSEQPVEGAPVLGFVNENGTVRIARQAVSADGSRVVWSERTGNHHLYLRDVEREQTVRLDSAEAACTSKGKCKGEAHPVFQTASSDGSRIFFTDSQPLTLSAGNSDLYECEIEESEEGKLACKLSDLTPPGAGEEGARVLGLVAGASEDGSVIYFTANGKLSAGPNGRKEEAVAGSCKGNTGSETPESETAPERCNLYARSNGQTKLVAVLSGADFPDWSLRGTYGLRGLTDRVSPDGRYLAFMSRLPLSGYDNHDAQSGKADEEVFLYDSGANEGAGGLVCASCDPSGGRPRGVPYKQINSNEGGLSGGAGIWPAGAWVAASIPGWTAISGGEGFALHQPRYLTNTGRLFFNAADGLVPEDTNRTEDVYQYEPEKVGSCLPEEPTFARASGGCVSLISSGTAKGESAFLDASESGNDVFFLTAQRLLPRQDVDQSVDVYDAHACSPGLPACLPEAPPPPPACEGDSCQSPGAPPEDQTPGSLSFQGPGNPPPPGAPAPKHKTAAEVKAEKLAKALKACHSKQNKRKRAACEVKARKLYGPQKAKAKAKAKKSKKASRDKR